MSASFDVLPYSITVMGLCVEEFTGTPLHQVLMKRQIRYLDNYLSSFIADGSQDSVTMVVENYYVDGHYLDDHAEYYLRCFVEYPKTCIRIHFFLGKELTHQAFVSSIEAGPATSEAKQLNDGYLGHAVIRPIPSTFLARLCLKPFPRLLSDENVRLVTTPINANLYGLALNFGSVPIQEQDRILAACATSALWSFYFAHPLVGATNTSAPSKITKSAFPDRLGERHSIPVAGLTVDQMCRSIKAQGIEPRVFALSEKGSSDLLSELVYAYCSLSQPAILGVDVSSPRSGQASKGLHAVTVLGYRITPGTPARRRGKLRLFSHLIQKLYIHDDRTGAFARLERSGQAWTLSIDTTPTKKECDEELYTPDQIIFGTHPKVRIQYPKVLATCENLVKRLVKCVQDGLRNNRSEALKFGRRFDNLVWRIQLSTVNDIKERVLASKELITPRLEVATLKLPKHVWVVQAYEADNISFEMYFDATDLPQGVGFLGVVHYRKWTKLAFESFAAYCKAHVYRIETLEPFSGTPPDHLWGVVEFFSRSQSYPDSLDSQYGPARRPKRIKNHELEAGEVHDQKAKTIYNPSDAPQLDENNLYIWVINEHGGLVLGVEHRLSDGQGMGHPTLLRGRPGRIGGELYFAEGEWRINAKSGRYSFSYTIEEALRLLDSVKRNRFEVYFRGTKFVVHDERAFGMSTPGP